KRLSEELLGKINMKLVELSANKRSDDVNQTGTPGSKPTHKGNLLMDATVSPQDIAYPTDLNLLNEARQISEQIIDFLHQKSQRKPRTYRNIARKAYLKVAKSKKASRKKIRKAVKGQLNYLRRNLSHIDKLLDQYPCIPFTAKMHRSYLIIQTLYDQQLELYREKKTSIDHRIVSIWQPHVRPIVRGKAKAKTEFGAKIHLSMIDGFAFIDTISWDAFHEGKHLSGYVENYKQRFGYYPEKVLVDRLYCTRENRRWLKERGIKLAAKPLGRPSKKAVVNHVSPGERNPIEGKFGQAKTRYGMGRIKARLKQTSQSWIASIVLVLNLVNLTRTVPYWLNVRSFSVSYLKLMLKMKQLLDTYEVNQYQNGYLSLGKPVLIRL
ncbi:MAG: transposase, partial [Bacteroidota bacterium]